MGKIKYGRNPSRNPSLRQQVEAEIERMIALLDALDPDPDLEPDTDGEPSLGGGVGLASLDLENDPSDAEPWMGWTDSEAITGNYATDIGWDREMDFSDAACWEVVK
jgi:hypothetical protein